VNTFSKHWSWEYVQAIKRNMHLVFCANCNTVVEIPNSIANPMFVCKMSWGNCKCCIEPRYYFLVPNSPYTPATISEIRGWKTVLTDEAKVYYLLTGDLSENGYTKFRH
jgi:hypothetical protein